MKEYNEKPEGWVEDKEKAEAMAYAGDHSRDNTAWPDAKILGELIEADENKAGELFDAKKEVEGKSAEEILQIIEKFKADNPKVSWDYIQVPTYRKSGIYLKALINQIIKE